MKKVVKGMLMPFWYWKLTQYLKNKIYGNKSNTLSPVNEELEKLYDSRFLHEEIKKAVIIESSNKWTLDVEVINYLWRYINKARPKVILEFGSGTSTVLFTKYFRKYPDIPFTLITIDQDEKYLNKTIEALIPTPKNLRFSSFQFNVDNTGFLIDKVKLGESLGLEKIDLILIDAPYGGWMARKETLPRILEFCKNGAIWFLDDSFRDSEMEIIRRWKLHKNVKVEGIINLGKGLGKGFVNNDK